MHPKQVEKLLKQIGVKARELDVEEVVFRFRDGTVWVFREPQVVETEALGQKVYQVSGSYTEEVSDEDVQIVMEKAGVDEKTAREALKKAGGDIAEAIMLLSQ